MPREIPNENCEEVKDIFEKYAPYLVAISIYDSAKSTHGTYMKQNKTIIDDFDAKLVEVYRIRPFNSLQNDSAFIKEIFIKHLPDADVDAWSRRHSVMNLKGLTGAQLDLRDHCRFINKKANKMFTKLKSKMFPKLNQVVDEFDGDEEADEDIEQLKEKHKVQISELDATIKGRDKTIANLRKDVIDLTTDKDNLQKVVTDFQKRKVSSNIEEGEEECDNVDRGLPNKKKRYQSFIPVESSPDIQEPTVESSPDIQEPTVESSPDIQESTVESSSDIQELTVESSPDIHETLEGKKF